jgi:hypothetical protein
MLFGYSVRDFKQAVRMDKPSFERLNDMIKDDPVFHNNAHNKQTPVWVQLMIVLQRLGCDGNGAATGRIARSGGFGNGTVNLFTYRIFHALNKFKKQFISWPNAAERKDISIRFARDHGLPGCVSIVDGTPIVISQRPGIDGEVYWTRKSHYALNLQLFCDDNLIIRYYQCGWPGTVYDSSVHDKCNIHIYPHRYFSNGEWIMGDAGYGAESYLCTPFRQPAASVPHNKVFNELFSSARCKIEHVNGILKARWSSLRGIRIQVKTIDDFRKINEHVEMCILLHNMLMTWKDEWEEYYEPEDQDPAAIAAVGNLVESASAHDLRVRVQSYLLDWFYSWR